MYGIVMYLMPSISPRSWMRTTFLCVTCRASSSSRLKRLSSSAAASGSADRVDADDLDRDRDFEHLVPGLVDRAHPADAEHPDDVVAGAEVLPDAQRAHHDGAVCARVSASPSRVPVTALVSSLAADRPRGPSAAGGWSRRRCHRSPSSAAASGWWWRRCRG